MRTHSESGEIRTANNNIAGTVTVSIADGIDSYLNVKRKDLDFLADVYSSKRGVQNRIWNLDPDIGDKSVAGSSCLVMLA